jgi:hypothetical protein
MGAYHHHWVRPFNLDIQTFLVLTHDMRLLLSQITTSKTQTVASTIIVQGPHGEKSPLADDNTIGFRINGQDLLLRRFDATRCFYEDFTSHINHDYMTDTLSLEPLYDPMMCPLLICIQPHIPYRAVQSTADTSVWKDTVTWYLKCFSDRAIPPGPWSSDALNGTALEERPCI